MGDYLSTPITTKNSLDGETSDFAYAASEMQGWRTAMEDTHLCIPKLDDTNLSLFGVFDGHGGPHVAIFAKRYLPDILKALPSFKAKDYCTALTESFLEIDNLLESESGKVELTKIQEELKASSADPVTSDYIGCTACVVLMTGEEIVVANSGDSRCVLCKSGVAIDLSEDHKPDLSSEETRIKFAGGSIEDNRVNGILSLTRSLGDLQYKKNAKLSTHEQVIIAKPDVRIERVEADCKFLLIACDGIWECMTSQTAVNYVKEKIAKFEFTKPKDAKLSKVIEHLFDKNITTDATNVIGADNMTCIIVKFKHT